MNRSSYPCLIDEQFMLVQTADRAWEKMNRAANTVCCAIETHGHGSAFVREQLAKWNEARRVYGRALNAAEDSRKVDPTPSGKDGDS